MHRRTCIWLLALAAALSLGSARSARAAESGGSLVLVGGKLRDPAIYREIVRRAGGSTARIGIISDASRSYADENASDEIRRFTRYGARAERVELDKDGNLKRPEQLRHLTGLFFSGGDQDRLRQLFRPYGNKSRGFKAIEAARERGMLLIAGSSAGAAIQVGPHMLKGGESYEALAGKAKDPSDALDYTSRRRPGFGFFHYGVLDTHCSERGREGRIAAVAAHTGQSLAFGVGENTALFVGREVNGRVPMHVIGKSGVSIVDLSRASIRGVQRSRSRRLRFGNLRLSHLTDGDGLTLRRDGRRWAVERFQVSKAKVRPSRKGPAPTTHDVFSSYRNRQDGGRKNPAALVSIARTLWDHQQKALTARAFEDHDVTREASLRVRLTKDADSRAFGQLGRRTFTNLRLDIRWRRPRRLRRR